MSFALNSTDCHCSYQDLVDFLEEIFPFFCFVFPLGKFPETLNGFLKIVLPIVVITLGNRSAENLLHHSRSHCPK